VHADLALADQAVLAHMHEFDGVLDGENMALFAAVDVVDHGGERGGLPRSGLARDQYQAAVDLAQVHDRFGQLEFGGGARLGWNGAKHRTHAVQLAHHIDAKAGDAGDAVRKVRSILGLEAFDRQLRHDLVQRGLDHLGCERLGAQRFQLAVLANPGRVACEKVKVRAVALEHLVQKAVDGWHEVP